MRKCERCKSFNVGGCRQLPMGVRYTSCAPTRERVDLVVFAELFCYMLVLTGLFISMFLAM